MHFFMRFACLYLDTKFLFFVTTRNSILQTSPVCMVCGSDDAVTRNGRTAPQEISVSYTQLLAKNTSILPVSETTFT